MLPAPTMSGMSEMNPREARRLSRLFLVGLPLFVFAIDFVHLLVTYLVLASIAPNVPGEVAVSPAVFAAWIALVKLPMTLACIVVVAGRALKAMVTTGDVPDPPVRKGWRRILVRVRDEATEVVVTVAGALIVFDHVADPGDAQVWQLVAVTAVGPFLLPKSVAGLFWLLRWWWQRRPSYRPRHARPNEEHSPDQPDQVGETQLTAHSVDRYANYEARRMP